MLVSDMKLKCQEAQEAEVYCIVVLESWSIVALSPGVALLTGTTWADAVASPSSGFCQQRVARQVVAPERIDCAAVLQAVCY